MKPIINPWWIYLAGQCENVMALLTIGGAFLLVASIIWGIAHMEGDVQRSPKKIFTIAIIALLISALIPDQETVYTMMTVRYVTPNNIKTVGSTVESTIDYIVDKIDEIIEKE